MISGSLLRREGALAAELAAVTAMAIARPVFDGFGASPETFIARGSGAVHVLAFGLAIAVLPWVLLLAAGAVAKRFAGEWTRSVIHLAAVSSLAAVAAFQIMRLETSWPVLAVVLVCISVALAVAALHARTVTFRSFLRYAGLASVIFLVQFLTMSPASSLIRGGRSGGPDGEATTALRTALGDDAPPVVVVVLDALPTGSLLDGEGTVDGDAFPNLAALVDDSTWYRNHTTVAPYTLKAVPAIFSGQVLDRDASPVAAAYPDNLFTLLGGTYDLHVEEQVTALCPDDLCPDATTGEMVPLLKDAVRFLGDSLASDHPGELVPGAFEDRYDNFRDWIDDQDFSAGSRPDLFTYHLMMPHAAWEFLPDGDQYRASNEPFGLGVTRWGPVGMEVGAQRHVLQTQAADELLGRMFDRMRDAGTYDDALIVVTADHGVAFEPEEPWRALSEAQFDEIMWTPLIVKAPGQREGRVDDSNVQTVDILPTMADILGLDLRRDLDWDVDGIVPGKDSPRESDDKPILDWKFNTLHADEGEAMVRVDGDEGFQRVLRSDLVDGTGRQAAWRFTEYGDMLGDRLDDYTREDPLDVELETDYADRFDDIDLDAPELEFLAFGWVEAGRAVALVANGEIAAVVPARPTPFGVSTVHGLLHPEALAEGENEIEAYQIEGPADDPVLRRLDIVPKRD